MADAEQGSCDDSRRSSSCRCSRLCSRLCHFLHWLFCCLCVRQEEPSNHSHDTVKASAGVTNSPVDDSTVSFRDKTLLIDSKKDETGSNQQLLDSSGGSEDQPLLNKKKSPTMVQNVSTSDPASADELRQSPRHKSVESESKERGVPENTGSWDWEPAVNSKKEPLKPSAGAGRTEAQSSDVRNVNVGERQSNAVPDDLNCSKVTPRRSRKLLNSDSKPSASVWRESEVPVKDKNGPPLAATTASQYNYYNQSENGKDAAVISGLNSSTPSLLQPKPEEAVAVEDSNGKALLEQPAKLSADHQQLPKDQFDIEKPVKILDRQRSYEDQFDVEEHLWQYIEKYHKKDLDDVCRDQATLNYNFEVKKLNLKSTKDNPITATADALIDFLQKLYGCVVNEPFDTQMNAVSNDKLKAEVKSLVKKHKSILYEDKSSGWRILGPRDELERLRREFDELLWKSNKPADTETFSNRTSEHAVLPAPATTTTTQTEVEIDSILQLKLPCGIVLKVYKQDLLKEQVDAIVNPANVNLIHASGAAKAISDAAGSELSKECHKFVDEHKALSVGAVMHTTAGKLNPQIKYVIHAAGPRAVKFSDENELYNTLIKTFHNCLNHANTVLELRSVSIPAISSGIYGVPKALVANAAYEALKQFDRKCKQGVIKRKLEAVHFVNIDVETTAEFMRKFREHFPSFVAAPDEGEENSSMPDDAVSTAAIVTAAAAAAMPADASVAKELVYDRDEVDSACAPVAVNHMDSSSQSQSHSADSSSSLLKTINTQHPGLEPAALTRAGVSVTHPNIDVHQPSTSSAETVDGQVASQHHLKFVTESGIAVEVLNKDLTKESVDAIVCSVDTSVNLGGGAARAIVRAVGDQMEHECRSYVAVYGMLQETKVFAVPAGKLSGTVKHIILAAAPQPKGTDRQLQALLTDTFFNCIVYANDTLNSKSISIPAIGAGVYRMAKEHVATAAYDALMKFDQSMLQGRVPCIQQIHFANIDGEVTRAFVDEFQTRRRQLGSQSQSLQQPQPTTTYLMKDSTVRYHFITSSEFMVQVCCNDLLKENVDAIVCSVDDRLKFGSAAKVIANAAGSSFEAECQDFMSKSGRLQFTDVTHVTAGDLRPAVKYVILAAVPVSSRCGNSQQLEDALFRTFYNCMRYANSELGVTSLSIPAIGAGNVGAERSTVAKAAFAALMQLDSELCQELTRKLAVVRFVNIDNETTRVFEILFQRGQLVSGSMANQHDYNSLPEYGGYFASPDVNRFPSLDTSLSYTASSSYVDPNSSSSSSSTQQTQQTTGNQVKRERRLRAPTDSSSTAAVDSLSRDDASDPKKAKRDSSTTTTATTTAAVDSSSDDCVICMCPMTVPKKLPCGHVFCKDCIEQSFDKCSPKCPSCGRLYGVMKGNQPPGRISVSTEPRSLPGYEGYGTIVIRYDIPSGIQNDAHPNPGQPYQGTQRSGLLPDNAEGREISKMLQQAFDAGLIFTVGRSVTTGNDNAVVWNDIHHKTSYNGQYGYPDATYLSRVKDELAAKGITSDPQAAI